MELKILIDFFLKKKNWKSWIFWRIWKFWFFFWKIWKSWIFSRNWKFWLMIFFFESNLRSTSPMPLVPRPFLKISLFFFWKDLERIDFVFLKYEDLFIIKKWRRWRWRWSKSDEDLFMMIFVFFFVEKPILWMRITLARSWCGLPDKSLLNSCKMIISISNGFIHWN